MAKDRDILIVGAGGHAKVVVEVARAIGWNPVACIGREAEASATLGGADVAADDPVVAWLEKGVRHAAVAIGDNRTRQALSLKYGQNGFTLPKIIHPSALISETASVEDGTIVMPFAVLQADARVRTGAIINTGVIIEHDSIVDDYAHVAPRSVLGGGVRLGKRVLCGIGSAVRPGVRVADDVTIGAGAVVVRDIDSDKDSPFVGVPARGRGDRLAR